MLKIFVHLNLCCDDHLPLSLFFWSVENHVRRAIGAKFFLFNMVCDGNLQKSLANSHLHFLKIWCWNFPWLIINFIGPWSSNYSDLFVSMTAWFLGYFLDVSRKTFNCRLFKPYSGLQIFTRLVGRSDPWSKTMANHFLKWWAQAYQTNHSWQFCSVLYLQYIDYWW